jgi:hypothetical protein
MVIVISEDAFIEAVWIEGHRDSAKKKSLLLQILSIVVIFVNHAKGLHIIVLR